MNYTETEVSEEEFDAISEAARARVMADTLRRNSWTIQNFHAYSGLGWYAAVKDATGKIIGRSGIVDTEAEARNRAIWAAEEETS